MVNVPEPELDMPLTIGDLAPSFSLQEAPGVIADVGACFGNEPVVILFFPLAFSGVCSEEFCAIRDDWAAWSELGVRVFGVSVDNPFVSAQFRESESLPFPLLSDFNKTVTTEWGCLCEDLMGLKGVAKRAAFVVGADGRVCYAWVSEDAGVQPDFEAVKAAVVANA